MKTKVTTCQILRYIVIIFIGLSLSAISRAETPIQKLSIDQAIQIAMAKSQQRQLAQSDVKIAQDKVAQATAAYGPKLTLSGGYSRYDDQPGLVKLHNGLVDLNNGLSASLSPFGAHIPLLSKSSEDLNYYGYQIHLEQPIYTGSKLTATKNQAKANAENSQANLAAAENDLVLAVKKAYYTVLLCQQFVVTMDEAVASMEHHMNEANAYYKAGLVPRLDVLRAEGKLAELTQKQLSAQNSLKLARENFNFVLGVDSGTVYSLDDKMEYGKLPQDLNSCQQKALVQRPEIAAFDAQVKMAQQAVVIAQSGNKPMVALVIDGHHYEPNNETPSWTAGVVATMKLWDNGMVSHQIAEAEDTLKKAMTGKELLERGIRLEVEQAYHNAEVSLQTIEVAQKNLKIAQEALETAQARYKVGLSTSLERIDAEVGLTAAKTDSTQALTMFNIALAELNKAMGYKTNGK